MKQLSIILSISLIGEILNRYIPLPIPASIYGIILLFLLLVFNIIKVDMIEDTASFLIEIMPIMFVPAAVGVMQSWNMITHSLLEYSIVVVVTTFIVMAVTGMVTQIFVKGRWQ